MFKAHATYVVDPGQRIFTACHTPPLPFPVYPLHQIKVSMPQKNVVYGGKLKAINLLWLVNQSQTRAARWKLTLSQKTTNWGCSDLSWTSVSRKCVQKANNEGCVVETEDRVVMQCHCCLLSFFILFLVLLLLLLSLFLFLPPRLQSWHKGDQLTSGEFVVLWLRLIVLQLDFKCFHVCVCVIFQF